MEGEIDVTGKNGKVCDPQVPGTELGGTSPGQNVATILVHLLLKSFILLELGNLSHRSLSLLLLLFNLLSRV